MYIFPLFFYNLFFTSLPILKSSIFQHNMFCMLNTFLCRLKYTYTRRFKSIIFSLSLFIIILVVYYIYRPLSRLIFNVFAKMLAILHRPDPRGLAETPLGWGAMCPHIACQKTNPPPAEPAGGKHTNTHTRVITMVQLLSMFLFLYTLPHLLGET